jgi:hypothetical protein
MAKIQFRILYREFLFRMIDLEVLSAQGNLSKLLGQFAAILVLISVIQTFGAIGIDSHLPRQAFLIALWRPEHGLIATTMLVVGIFAVLSWGSTFPTKRDVMVLAPLPVRARTLFLAKVAASGAALGLTVGALHILSGLVWPLALAPQSSSLLDLILSPSIYRAFAAYWITMAASGAFILCSVLCLQGLAAQLLARRLFLRLSSFLQLASFCAFLCIYFLEPSLATPKALAAPENQNLLAWLPSYWFLGLLQQLNGWMDPSAVTLARRAWMGLAAVITGATIVFLLSYYRTLRKVAEEPDITPGFRAWRWWPPFGNPMQTAVVQFSVRTLLRSRQHRLILAFYWGVGLSMIIFLLRTPTQRQLAAASEGVFTHKPEIALLFSSIALLCFAILGVRVLFSIPLDLKANWIFRVVPIHGGIDCLSASRRTLLVLGVAPVLAASTIFFLSIWAWQEALGHLVVLALLALIMSELCLSNFRKIPFTCSYLPGKSYAHMTIFAVALLSLLLHKGAQIERSALTSLHLYVELATVLLVVGAIARWRTSRLARMPDAELQFEDRPEPAIAGLGLFRDGVLPAAAVQKCGPAVKNETSGLSAL